MEVNLNPSIVMANAKLQEAPGKFEHYKDFFVWPQPEPAVGTPGKEDYRPERPNPRPKWGKLMPPR